MRGSIKAQVGAALRPITKYGTSSRREETAAKTKLQAAGVSSRDMIHEVAAHTGIYHDATRANVFSKLVELGEYCKSEFGVKDITKITPDQVNAFLEEKIEMQLTYGHVNSYVEALNKLEYGLEKLLNAPRQDFYSATREIMKIAKEECSAAGGRNRAYSASSSLVSSLTSPVHQLTAEIEHKAGLRISAATNISADQLRGVQVDRYTGKMSGIVEYINKGGGKFLARMPVNTYERLADHIAANGSLQVPQRAFYDDLKAACEKTNERYEGSHGLRYCYAQERYTELRGVGCSKLEAMSIISEEMGHHRMAITQIYLGNIAD